MDLRRSFGHAGDRVTTATGFLQPTSSSELSAVQTSTRPSKEDDLRQHEDIQREDALWQQNS